MVMECLEGEDLAATLANDGPLDWRRVLSIGTQVCRALIDAHARGVVHCDIKPGNCFRISRDGTDDFIKVLDFGVSSVGAREGDVRPTSGPVIGTPGYMPQEQLRGGPYDHRVDIFALGVLMFRLLTNKMPYSGGSLFVPRRPTSGPIALSAAPRRPWSSPTPSRRSSSNRWPPTPPSVIQARASCWRRSSPSPTPRPRPA